MNEATQRQIEAASPNLSTWLSANAGSGKTRVLTDRVARLLLDGVQPENILCLTYTKAAASEMQNRLFKRLGAWAMMEDGPLRVDLDKLGVPFRPDGQRLRHARTLFAKAIETPGGLKIQTIHSFCASILRRFPLEAGISPQFREMEDRDAQLLRDEVLNQIAESDDVGVLDRVARATHAEALQSLTEEIVKHRPDFSGSYDPILLARSFGLGPNPKAADAIEIALIGGEADLVKDIADCAKSATKYYQGFAANLSALDLNQPTLATVHALFKPFLYAETKLSKSANFPQSSHTNAVTAFAPVIDDLHAWMDRTADAYQYLKSLEAFDRSDSMHRFARVFLPLYDRAKLSRGALDFDDLIRKTRDLLHSPGLAAWVLFKLDGGIDHILVDEAQDTSPEQWQVISALAGEFAAGVGSKDDTSRTIFVVGDKKQSIYSFQGADPKGFDRMRDYFADQLKRIGAPLQDTALSYSFRSSNAILRVVDQTFTGEFRTGLEAEVFHRAFKSDLPGRVDLWPYLEKSADEVDKVWYEPVDYPGAVNNETELAAKIADSIRHMVDHETIPIEPKDGGPIARRKITEGDILILVRRRSGLFHEIIRACKARGLAIAGADVLNLLDELAVRDILAVLRFLSLAEDDLSLACALKSPIFGWSEQDLYSLASGRPDGQFLWQRLRDSTDPTHVADRAILDDLRGKADFLRPYDLISRLLIRHQARDRLRERLGDEVEDGIDGLLSQALAFERGNLPNLTAFLRWIYGEEIKVKRQMDAASDRIRVMTVHGSKGLEAPIVFLPETGERRKEIKSQTIPTPEGGRIWKTLSGDRPWILDSAEEAVKEAQEEERRRLLYVAMTRAEKWLIVAGTGAPLKPDAVNCWYQMIESAMTHLGTTQVVGPSGDLIQRYSELDWDGLDLTDPKPPQTPIPETPAFGTVAPTTPRKSTIPPSGLGGAKVMPMENDIGDAEQALARGTLIHRLLEHLPHWPENQRQTLGRSLVQNAEEAALVPDIDALLQDALGIALNPELEWLWNADPLTEVDVSAALPELDGIRIHGAIDLLVFDKDRIVIVDFKSNRSVPNTADQVPDGLLRQMGAYVSAVRQIYPNTVVQPAILWTSTARLMEIPAELALSALANARIT